ncbi:DegT/DnrJ/EryC1/StrS aminotransferase family protein [uncultured Streptomyces sp.]|uniref:DegT/DnrJ/EryC1/StrS family aminotransferase n=1 Tax=uncultured Streptomyces sp. TaxID=174707 RepID=UPI00262D95A1|nr:DegT/DnrJ/EryC1/StrS family aminotransferase [uncultured Streptomyces sp.]
MTAAVDSRLAMLGGPRSVPRGRRIPAWPRVTPDDEAAVLRSLRSGAFTAAAAGETEIPALEAEWARYVGTGYALAVSNGTAALSLALAAAGVQPGDEVVVPALSFVASGIAPLHIGATPVFADIDPETFNVDAASVAAALTSRTRAVVVVHLHGLPADMDEILALTEPLGIPVVEDAAQAHGALYRGARVGSLGLVNSFSLNVSKNLATCGEGGLVNTDDPDVHRRALALRQFGEVIESGKPRLYVSHALGWNHKPSSLQCAFTRSQLSRFPDDAATRDTNVREFLSRLRDLPGLLVPSVPDDRTHAWHILRFRLDPEAFGLPAAMTGPLRAAVIRALRAEGVPAAMYQHLPLPAQPVFRRPLDTVGYPPGALRAVQGWSPHDTPATCRVIEGSFVIQKAHLHPDAAPLLDLYAQAVRKVWAERDVLVGYARDLPYQTPWEQKDETPW